MSHREESSQELDRLLEKLCEEQISEQERQRLNQLLRESQDARWQYLAHMDIHAALSCLPGVPSVRLEKEQHAAIWPSAVFDVLGDTFQKGADFFSRGIVLSLLLAIGLPGIVLAILMIDIARQPVAVAPPSPAVEAVAPQATSIAEITKLHHCVWEDGTAQQPMGTKLSAGQQLRLASGLVEVTFDDGVKVVLQGPMTFDVRDQGEGFLRDGRLVADVPKGAEGFIIRTPSAVVVDLGTEFGVQVDTDGTSEAHVILGLIKVGAATPEGVGQPMFQEFCVGQAAKVHRASGKKTIQVERIASTSDQFIRRLPPETNRGLPAPDILFAHRGKNDPLAENWILLQARDTKNDSRMKLMPVDEAGTQAWLIHDYLPDRCIQYRIQPRQGLDSAMSDRAKKNGWVLRAKIKVSGEETLDTGLCHCAYRDDKRAWVLRAGLNRNGNQHVILLGRSSLGKDAKLDIPNSQDRYVSYEIRYRPETNSSDVYVDGHCVATGLYKSRGVEKIGLQFGTDESEKCDARFALVEWGPLREAATTEQSRGK